jgi:hypothetical protein
MQPDLIRSKYMVLSLLRMKLIKSINSAVQRYGIFIALILIVLGFVVPKIIKSNHISLKSSPVNGQIVCTDFGTYISKFGYSVTYPCNLYPNPVFDGKFVSLQFQYPESIARQVIVEGGGASAEANIVIGPHDSQPDIINVATLSTYNENSFIGEVPINFKRVLINNVPVLRFELINKYATFLYSIVRVGDKNFYVDLYTGSIDQKLRDQYDQIVLSIKSS